MTTIPTFATASSFLGVAASHRDAAFTVAGIPHDIGVTNRSGSRFGPAAIRLASRGMAGDAHPEFWTDPTSIDLADLGNFRVAVGEIAATMALIEEQATGLGHLLAMGGEHSISLPLLRALRKRLGKPLAMVHFDAHVDTWPDNYGQAYGHGSPFFHAINEGLIDPARTIQIGIRSPVEKAVWDWTVDRGVTILRAVDVHMMGPQAVIARVRQVVGDAPTYFTYDVDCLDPAFAPGTGTPEFGGLFPWQTQAILRGLTGIDFVGMDVVEVLPAHDVSEITALAAATVMWDYLCLVVSQRR